MTITKANKEKFLKNLLKFTAPGLAVFFAQLALGAKPEVAWATAVLVFWGVLSDLFKKIK